MPRVRRSLARPEDGPSKKEGSVLPKLPPAIGGYVIIRHFPSPTSASRTVNLHARAYTRISECLDGIIAYGDIFERCLYEEQPVREAISNWLAASIRKPGDALALKAEVGAAFQVMVVAMASPIEVQELHIQERKTAQVVPGILLQVPEEDEDSDDELDLDVGDDEEN